MLIEVQDTPNTNAKKITLDGRLDFLPQTFNHQNSDRNLLAKNLLRDENISSLYFSPKFIVLFKRESSKWIDVVENACQIVTSHINSGMPIVTENNKGGDFAIDVQGNSIEIVLKNILNLKGYTIFLSKDSESDLANDIFDMEGVDRVIFFENKISIYLNKNDGLDNILENVSRVLERHFNKANGFFNDPIWTSRDTDAKIDLNFSVPDDNRVLTPKEQEIVKVINDEVAPSIHADGGDIKFIKFKNGIVYVRLEGACVGCSSAETTLKEGVERLLKIYFDDVKEVLAI